jgi:hypothetical protein
MWLFCHPEEGSFKTTVTQTLKTVRGMKITPLPRYPTTTTWHNSHRLPLHNSGALPSVHELFKRPSYLERIHQNHERLVGIDTAIHDKATADINEKASG